MNSPPPQNAKTSLGFASRQYQSVVQWFAKIPLTREGWLWFLMALGLLLTGLAKSINLLTLLACMLVGLLALNWCWARQQLRRVVVERFQGEAFFAQTSGSWMWRILNTDRDALQGVRLEESFADVTCRWFVVFLPSQQSRWTTLSVTFPRRGLQKGKGLEIRSGFPFGLVMVRKSTGDASELMVFPKLGTVHRGRLRKVLLQAGPALERIKGSSAPFPSAQTEFHGLRTYRPGDSPRLIHWKTSARKNQLMVREFEDPPTDHLLLVVMAEIGPNLETVLSWACSVIWEWCRQKGDHLTLVLVGDTLTCKEGTTGRDLALDMLEVLAREPGTSNLREERIGYAFEGKRMPPGPILIITGETSAVPLIRSSWSRPAAELSVRSEKDAELFDFSKVP